MANEKRRQCRAAAYAVLYPGLAAICESHGYALAIHGSMKRDFDLIAVAWTDTPSEPESLIESIVDALDAEAAQETRSNHSNRRCWHILLNHHRDNARYLDFNVVPLRITGDDKCR